jgi:2-polyprenyl-3-methyl-5-hydroxy-6-metoxy-1,4-benzoquinol methylase
MVLNLVNRFIFDLPSASFDIITMWHVLEHVHELHEYMDQVRNLMKQHGMALIALPNYTSKDAAVYKEYWAPMTCQGTFIIFRPRRLAGLQISTR